MPYGPQWGLFDTIIVSFVLITSHSCQNTICNSSGILNSSFSINCMVIQGSTSLDKYPDSITVKFHVVPF